MRATLPNWESNPRLRQYIFTGAVSVAKLEAKQRYFLAIQSKLTIILTPHLHRARPTV